MIVVIGNTCHQLVEFFQARWGGVIRNVKPSSARAKPSFEWRISGYKAKWFLEDISQFVVSDKYTERIRLAIESENVRRAFGSLSPETRGRLHELRDRMRELNRRGVHVV